MRFWTVTPEEIRRSIQRLPRRMATRKTPGVKTKPPQESPIVINPMAEFNLPSGYTVTINENGLSRLIFGGAILGDGISQLLDGSWFYRTFDPLGFTPILATKSATYQPNGATVTHTYTGLLKATVVYTYTISGDDVHISALVSNTGTKPLQPAFRSMSFRRGSGGTFIGFGFDQSHTQNQGEKLSYPSVNVPYSISTWMGVTSTAGPQINFATWSEESPTEKFMSVGVGTPGFPGVATSNIFFNSVPPGGSRIYKHAFRFVNSSDWKDLLSTYKTQLRTVFPTIAYEPDARPLASFSSIHTSHIRPDNPYGYNDGGTGVFRRFDKLEGCQDYVAKLVPPMSATGYQGIVMWQPQGINPRGVQYRPDLNVFPPETEPNLPTLTSGFRNAGLNIGLLSRPNAVITAYSWNTDGLTRLTDHPDSVSDLKARLQWALGQNFNAFYLDSFVADGPDHNILKTIRDTIGPNVHTFCEHSTALSMAYSASYEEMSWNNGVVVNQRQQILRWLYPESIIATKIIGALPAGGYAQVYPAMFDLKLTPWVEDHRTIPIGPGSENSILQPLVAIRIGPNHRWL